VQKYYHIPVLVYLSLPHPPHLQASNKQPTNQPTRQASQPAKQKQGYRVEEKKGENKNKNKNKNKKVKKWKTRWGTAVYIPSSTYRIAGRVGYKYYISQSQREETKWGGVITWS